MSIATRGFHLKQLAICLSIALALNGANQSLHAGDAPQRFVGTRAPLPTTISAIRNVTSCLDDGTVGTLRQVVGVATSSDIVELSGLPLACSTITLALGEISIPQSSLIIEGPTDRTLTITTNQYGRILHHTGSGSLQVAHLTLSNGRYYSYGGTASGGCVFSSGNVSLVSSTVTGCMAVAGSGKAVGGGIYAAGYVELNSSQVTGSAAYSYAPQRVFGAGIYAGNGFLSFYSTVSGNFCSTALGGASYGGGASVSGLVSLYRSTIDSNAAGYGGGIFGRVGTTQFSVFNSTISGNQASLYGGGIAIFAFSPSSTLNIYNSTVAFNLAAHDAGIVSTVSVAAQSSIIAKNANTVPGGFADLYIFSGSGNSLTGQNNLIVSSNFGLGGTLTSDPRLLPLVNHGGPTRTHALLADSPAVDHGNNIGGGFGNDQRCPGFAREVPSGAPDIGAYERQANDDEIFADGFD